MTLSPSRRSRRSLFACLLSATLLALPASRAAGQSDGGLPATFPADSQRGEAAIAALGDELPTVAARNQVAAQELVDRLRADDTLWVDGEGRLFYVDTAVAREDFGQSPNSSYEGSIPVEDAFTLHSRPGASKTIYLDFTGHLSQNNSWGHNIDFPAYNTSGSPEVFANSELIEVITWWEYVMEDFAPFDVDVTTEEPPLSALTKSNGSDTTYGTRCVITQPTDGFGNGIGGVAFLFSFDDSIDNPVFAFNKGNNSGSMTCSHEVGHALGLSHDGLGSQQYHPGSGSGQTSWGPIMGAPFGASLVQWSNGDYVNSTQTQNDFNIISNSSNGINVMADDHGDDEFAASPIGPPAGCPVPTPGSATGSIERRSDVDAFTFTTTTSGMVTIDALNFDPGGNLDLQIELLDGAGLPVAIGNPEDLADATLSVDIPAGTYFVLIDGVGKTGEYSDYGSLGQYTVLLTLPGTQTFTNLGGSVVSGFGFPPVLQASGTPCPGETVNLNLINAPGFTLAYFILGFSELSAPFKGGILVPSIAPPSILLPLNTGVGIILFGLPWPAGLPPEVEMWVQYWVVDNGAPFGFAATDGIRLYAP